jgi:hypothetical protein
MITQERCPPPHILKTFSQVLAPNEKKVKKWKRDILRKKSVTFISSRHLLGRGDLRGTLGHQNNTLRGARIRLSYRLGILNILWWEKGGWRGMGIR